MAETSYVRNTNTDVNGKPMNHKHFILKSTKYFRLHLTDQRQSYITNKNQNGIVSKNIRIPQETEEDFEEESEYCTDYGQYIDSNGDCQDCNESCQACEGNAENCTGCIFGNFLQDNRCVPKCNVGYFQNDSRICRKCMDNCNKCNSTNTCQDCKKGYKFQQNQGCVEINETVDVENVNYVRSFQQLSFELLLTFGVSDNLII